MKATKPLKAFTLKRLALIASATALLGSCASVQSQQPQVKVDGSSTVFPITQAVAQEFQSTTSNKVQVTVCFSGTTGGFKKFCAGETDINNASRPMQIKEKVGTVFDGKSEFNLTIGELLRKQATF